MIYISKGNRRMNIPTFSLPAVVSCNNTTALCRLNCYARKAEKCYPNVLPSRERNYRESETNNFITQVKEWLDKHKPNYFRIHESGDFYNQEYLEKWFKIIKDYPDIKFLVYTQMYNLDYSKKPDNLVVYWTVWSDSSSVPKKGLFAYVVDNGSSKLPTNKYATSSYVCQKGKTIDKCDNCLHCFNGKGNVIFKVH